MGLNKVKIGQLISICDERNRDKHPYPFFGININKEFMPSVANTTNVDASKYKIVRKNRFVFSGMQTGRDNCIRIGIYLKDEPVLVSPAYTTFEVTSLDILPIYLFMIFNSKEKDRYGAFLSDSSVRSNLDWDRFCDIELELPPIDVQKKYVAIYEALLANMGSYEKSLDDLKLVCDGYIENLRKEYGANAIGPFIEEISERNSNLSVSNVLGISKEGFISPNQRPGDLDKYYIFKKDNFVYSPPRINVGSIGLYEDDKPAVCSPIYVVFKVKDKTVLNPKYLMMWLRRSEFLRSTDFYSIASVRNNFSYELMEQVKIAIPSIDVQNSIVKVFERRSTCEKNIGMLRKKLFELCPILIKGSIIEAKGGN